MKKWALLAIPAAFVAGISGYILGRKNGIEVGKEEKEKELMPYTSYCHRMSVL